MTVNLSGTVTDAETALPVVGADVHAIVPTDDDTVIDSATTDGDGLYSLDLDPQSVRVWAEADDYSASFYVDPTTVIDLVDVPVVADIALTALVPPSPSGYSLGDISPLWFSDFSGFGYPSFVQIVPIISDGSSTANSVIQSGSLPRRQATITLPWLSDADLAYLQGIQAGVTAVEMAMPSGTLDVIVTDLQASMVAPDLWTVTASLVEATFIPATA